MYHRVILIYFILFILGYFLFIIFLMIWQQANFCLVTSQSQNHKYNPIFLLIQPETEVHTCVYVCTYTQRNLFDISLNQPEIRLYSPFSD